jgi:hypothetical protein
MPIGTGHGQGQVHTTPVHDHMPLAALFAAIGRVRARLLAPRGLGTLAPSILARVQSI